MSDQLSILPVELIHRILDEIPTFDILTYVCFVNKRLHVISLNYRRFRFDLTRSFDKKRQFDEHCAQLVPLSSQVVSLTMANDGDATLPAKIACFFSQTMSSNITFSHLRFLSLSHVDRGVWESFKARSSSFVALTSISISFIDNEECVTPLFVSTVLNELLFFSSSLKCLSLRMAYDEFSESSTITPRPSWTTSSITHLTLDKIDVEMQSLLSLTPALHSFTSTADCSQMVNNIHLLAPVYLQRLSIIVDSITLVKIETLLSSMKCLTHFTLIADNVDEEWANGGRWERLLTTITIFKFKFTFCPEKFRREPADLQSFQTNFWLVEKKWYVTFDSLIKYNHPLLYSHPYCLDQYPFDQMIGTFVTKTTSPEPPSMRHVKRLDTAHWLPMSSTLLHRCTHVNDLGISVTSLDLSLSWRYVIAELNTSIITSLSIATCVIRTSTDATAYLLNSLPSVRSLRVSVSLLKMLLGYNWPRITQLSIVWGSDRLPKLLDRNQVDSFGRSFTRLQQLEFTRSFIDDIAQLLNSMMMTLTHVHIGHSCAMTADDDRFISSQWLERNTQLRNFHYSCDNQNRVHLWL